MLLGLLDVLDGDKADAVIGVIDDDQLLDAVLVQKAAWVSSRLVFRLTVTVVILGHQARRRAVRIGWQSARRGW